VSETTRFRVVALHASGGMGNVFVAKDDQLHRSVALKEIQEQFADDRQIRDRFLREAEVTGQLEHPGIVPVYAMGHSEDGRPYYVMRMIRGDSLKHAIIELSRLGTNTPIGWNCVGSSTASSPPATRSNTRTAGASSIATSNPTTSCSVPTAKRWSSIGDWPR
jgi:serine/threonine protein kinase